MIKLAALLVFVSACSQSVKGQTWDEWFKQKKTQKKYLLNQIAALKVYAGYVKKGYEIAETGLTAIGKIKNGDFNLHKDFFASFRSINPKVKHYAKIGEMISIQKLLFIRCKTLYVNAARSHQFNLQEIKYIDEVFSRLLSASSATIDKLIQLVSPNKIELTDDQRLERIDRLYVVMVDNAVFFQHFASDISAITMERINEQQDIQKSRIVNGLSN